MIFKASIILLTKVVSLNSKSLESHFYGEKWVQMYQLISAISSNVSEDEQVLLYLFLMQVNAYNAPLSVYENARLGYDMNPFENFPDNPYSRTNSTQNSALVRFVINKFLKHGIKPTHVFVVESTIHEVINRFYKFTEMQHFLDSLKDNLDQALSCFNQQRQLKRKDIPGFLNNSAIFKQFICESLAINGDDHLIIEQLESMDQFESMNTNTKKRFGILCNEYLSSVNVDARLKPRVRDIIEAILKKVNYICLIPYYGKQIVICTKQPKDFEKYLNKTGYRSDRISTNKMILQLMKNDFTGVMKALNDQLCDRFKGGDWALDKIAESGKHCLRVANAGIPAEASGEMLNPPVLFETSGLSHDSYMSIAYGAALKLMNYFKLNDEAEKSTMNQFIHALFIRTANELWKSQNSLTHYYRAMTEFMSIVFLKVSYDNLQGIDRYPELNIPTIFQDKLQLPDSVTGSISVTNYGMKGFSWVLSRVLDDVNDNNASYTMAVLIQDYFELLEHINRFKENVNSSDQTHIRIKECSQLSQITESVDMVWVDLHPNNPVQRRLHSHNVKKWVLDYFEQFPNSRLMIILDITLNLFHEDEVVSLIKDVQHHIDSGQLSIFLNQSLAKIVQLGTDLLSGGLQVYLFNPTIQQWNNMNEKIQYLHHQEALDSASLSYFSLLFHQLKDEQNFYLQKIRENTQVVYTQFNQMIQDYMLSEQPRMGVTFNLDTHTPYIAINFNQLFRKINLKNEAKAAFTQNVLSRLILPLIKTHCPWVTFRQSLGFPMSNLGVCRDTIRGTIGCESGEEIQKIIDMLSDIAFFIEHYRDMQSLLSFDPKCMKAINHCLNNTITERSIDYWVEVMEDFRPNEEDSDGISIMWKKVGKVLITSHDNHELQLKIVESDPKEPEKERITLLNQDEFYIGDDCVNIQYSKLTNAKKKRVLWDIFVLNEAPEMMDDGNKKVLKSSLKSGYLFTEQVQLEFNDESAHLIVGVRNCTLYINNAQIHWDNIDVKVQDAVVSMTKLDSNYLRKLSKTKETPILELLPNGRYFISLDFLS